MRSTQREWRLPGRGGVRLGLVVLLGAGLTSCGAAAAPADDAVTPAAASLPVIRSSVLRGSAARSTAPQWQGPQPPAPTSAPSQAPLGEAGSSSRTPVPLRAPASSPTSTAVPCTSGLGPGTPTGLDVSVRAGAAVVTWKAPDATTHPVENWLLAAADQEPPRGSTITWQTVAAGPGCGTVSATVTGLTSGHRYAFWLEDVVISAEDGIPQAHLYGTAAPVVIP